MPTAWADVVAKLTLEVNKAATTAQIDEAVTGTKPVLTPEVNTGTVTEQIDAAGARARPEVTPTVNTAGEVQAIDEAAASAHPEVTPGINTAGVAERIDEAAAAAHPEVTPAINTSGTAEQIDAAAAAAHPAVTPTVNEAALTEEIDRAAAAAHPVITPTVNEAETGARVQRAVTGAPPAAIPIDEPGVGRSVERGIAGADTAGAGREGATKYARGFSAPIGALKGMVMGAIGAEAIMGGQALFSSMITQAGAAAKAQKVVNDAIKITGGQAGVTGDQIDKMAGSQARATGVSKVAVEQSDALLLRFTNLRNEAGKGNDVFNRTSQASLDLTAALNKGVVSGDKLAATSRVLGKAMEDPAKAAGTLRRYGVDLDKQQQAQIKTFMASNDTLDAQKVILDAVNKSYGGTAAATASGTAKMKASMEELEAAVGKTLLPIFTDLIKIITRLLDVIAPVVEWFARGGTSARILKDAILGVAAAATGFIVLAKSAEIATRLWATAVKGAELAMKAYKLAVEGIQMATKAWSVIQGILDAELLANPIVLVVAAVALLTVGIIELYKHSALFRELVHDTWAFIRSVVVVAAHALAEAIGRIKDTLTGANQASKVFAQVWRLLWAGFAGPPRAAMALVAAVVRADIDLITGIFRAGRALITGIWRAEWDIMVAVLKTFILTVQAILRIFIDVIRGILKIGLDLMTGNWKGAWQAMLGTVHAVTGDITDWLHGVTGAWTSAISQAGNAIKDAWSAAWSDIAGATRNAWNAIYSGPISTMRNVFTHDIPGWLGEAKRAFVSFAQDLPRFFSDMVHGIASAWDGLKEAIHGPIAWVVNVPIEGLIKVFNTVGGSVHLPRIPDVHMAAAGGSVGKITAGTHDRADDVHIRVSRDETILSAAHSRILAPSLHQLGVPGYGAGGPVGPLAAMAARQSTALLLGMVPGFQFGGLITSALGGAEHLAERTAAEVESATRTAAGDAARVAGSVYHDVINGVVYVGEHAIDAGKIASDLAVNKLDSLAQGMENIASMTAPGAVPGTWIHSMTKAVTHEVTTATRHELGGIAGKAAHILGGGGLITEPVTGYGHRSGARYLLGESGPEVVTPGFALGGMIAALLGGKGKPPDLAGLLHAASGKAQVQVNLGGTLPDFGQMVTGLSSGGLLANVPTTANLQSQVSGLGDQLHDHSAEISDAVARTSRELAAQFASHSGQMTGQLAQIGRTLEQNPQAIANAIAQALNGVARLATAGAAFSTR